MYYEQFTGLAPDTNDLSGKGFWVCGRGTDNDGDTWSATCGDTNDNDPLIHP
jgi:hypothetical protein